jgi:ATP-dependent DNA ligase
LRINHCWQEKNYCASTLLNKFEGIVAKRAASTYKPGIRSKDWIKIKFTQKEIFGIVGHVESEGFLLSTADYEHLAKHLKQIPAPMPSKKPTVWFKPLAVEIEFMAWTKQGVPITLSK